jgi:hypothetical protein
MTMKLRILSVITVLALLLSLAMPQAHVAAAPPSPALAVPVTGTFDGGTFAGTLDITRFAVRNGEIVAIGTVSGTLSDLLGNVIGTVTGIPVAIPVADISGSCDILNLDLGPLDLNLLGLEVHLAPVVLDIVAQSGAGNLLGNLLCAVASLLDSNGALTAITLLLNQILGAIG